MYRSNLLNPFTKKICSDSFTYSTKLNGLLLVKNYSVNHLHNQFK